MNFKLSTVRASVMFVLAATPAHAVDFEYFKGKSCAGLCKELGALQKSEKAGGMAIRGLRSSTSSAVGMRGAVRVTPRRSETFAACSTRWS